MESRTLAEMVTLALDSGQYDTLVVRTVDDAAAALDTWRPHLVVLDLDVIGDRLFDRGGECALHAGGPPVVALTRRAGLDVRLSAFARGADDVLTVPFSPQELVARVLAIMRRTYRDAAVFAPVLRVGDIEIDVVRRHVRLRNTTLPLTTRERSLLYLLAANAGRLVTRDEILDCLWGADYVAESNIVDRHIRNLRVKLHRHAQGSRYIATVPGRGYRFVPAHEETS